MKPNHDVVRRPNVWPATGLLLVIVVVGVWIGRSATRDGVMLAALVTAAGIMAMAWLVSRDSAVPRWVLWTTAAAMSIVLVTGALFAPPEHGSETRTTAWMLPWFLLMMGTTTSRKSGWCDISTTRGGWIMVATGLFLALIGVLAPWVPKWW